MSVAIRHTWQGTTAALLGLPAALGLLLFLIVPFLMAASLTVTDQKLLSPNDAKIVWFKNYERLLAVSLLVQKPIEQADQSVDDATLAYPRIRDVTRTTPKYEGFRPLATFHLLDRRIVVLAKDPVFIRSLFNTFLFALMVVPLQAGLALGLAMIVNLPLKGKTVFRTVYFSPVVMTLVVVSVVWAFLYHKDAGLINAFLNFVTGGERDIDWIGEANTAMPSIVVMSAWQGAGVQMLIFLAGLQSIPQELYEAARIDGANAWQRFVNITIPGLRNTIAFVAIVTTINAFGLFAQIDVMTQGGPAHSTSTVMFHAIERGVRELDIAYGATITVIYFLIIASIALIQQRYFNKRQA